MPLLKLARPSPARVFEIGCGSGQSLRYFKQEHGSQYVAGIEFVPAVAARAQNYPEIDRVFTGDIETIDLGFPDGHFDLVIASHVLEHVKDPWAAARKIHRMLAPGGQFIGSLPNVRNVRVSVPLLLWGKWEYTPEGIMDWTHTKFFSKQTIRHLLSTTGFSLQVMEPEFAPTSGRLNRLTLGLAADLFCYTYNFAADPAPFSAREVQ